jgi:hypothetical protein
MSTSSTVVKNCNTECKIRELSPVEEAISASMELVRSYLADELEKGQIKEHLGRNSFCEYRAVNDVHYLINLLSIFRQDLDAYIKYCGCIDSDILQKFKDKYQIDCILSNALCGAEIPIQKIYQLFLPKTGYCDDVKDYEWLDFECTETP